MIIDISKDSIKNVSGGYCTCIDQHGDYFIDKRNGHCHKVCCDNLNMAIGYYDSSGDVYCLPIVSVYCFPIVSPKRREPLPLGATIHEMFGSGNGMFGMN